MRGICFLKLFSDLCLLFTGASLFLKLPQERALPFFLAAALLALVFALASLGEKRGWLRFLPLCLAPAVLFLPGASNTGIRIVLALVLLYTAFCVTRGVFLPDREEQLRLFSYGWMIIGGIFFLSCVLNWERALALTLPLGAAALLSSILLNRSLRHEPAVRDSLSFQVLNGLSLGGVVLGALLIGSPAVMKGLGSVLGWIYKTLIQPVLMAFVTVAMALIRALGRLARRIGLQKPEIKPQPIDSSAGEISTEWMAVPEKPLIDPAITRSVLIILAALAIVFILWKLARVLKKKRARQGAEGVTRRTIQIEEEPEIPERGPLKRIREQYRKYLKLYREKDIRISPSDTSLKVQKKGLEQFDGEAMEELREIYIKARYGGRGEAKDAEKARSLLKQIRKSDRS